VVRTSRITWHCACVSFQSVRHNRTSPGLPQPALCAQVDLPLLLRCVVNGKSSNINFPLTSDLLHSKREVRSSSALTNLYTIFAPVGSFRLVSKGTGSLQF
jgi:hypothetical protein